MIRDAAGTVHRPCRGTPRIVSLVPSLTELVCELGLADRLVGRTGFCVHPRERLRTVPKLGGTKDVRLDRLCALAPTHVIVNVDENRREDVAAIARCGAQLLVTHPLVPEDNPALYALFGAVFRCEAAAERLAREFAAARAALRQAAGGWPRERVLYLIWRAPWMSVARDTYISATLAAAGWDTLPETAPARYPQIDAADPAWRLADRILLPSEPYRFLARHAEELERAGLRVSRVDGEMVSWYGSRAAAGLRYLARLRDALAAGRAGL